MPRRQKTGNYSEEDRRNILFAATSDTAGATIAEKQQWLLNMGVHRPGVPSEPVSESAIKYWKNAHRKAEIVAKDQYEQLIERLISSPPSYRALKNKFSGYITGSESEEA